MANTQPNNSPFIPTLNFAPAVEGVSTSPFTDQRAVATGGGTPGTGDGNVSYNAAGSNVLSYELTPGGGDIVIDTITQPDTITISSANNAVLASTTADAAVVASQDAILTGNRISATSVNNSSYTSTNGTITVTSVNEAALVSTTSDASVLANQNVILNGAGISAESTNNSSYRSTNGNVNVTASNGQVTIESSGDALLQSTAADVGVVADQEVLITANEITASSTNDSTYASNSGNVTVDSVTGITTVQGGTNATLQSNNGSVNVAAISGPVNIDGNTVNIDAQNNMDLASSTGNMSLKIRPLLPLNRTASIEMTEPTLINETVMSLKASEIDLISYTDQTNGISLQTRDINTNNIIAEFALNSAVTNSVPDAIVGRNVQYYQFATRDPGFEDPPADPLQPTYRFSTNTGAWRFIDRPNAAGPSGGPLQWNGEGDGQQNTPYQLSFANAGVNSLSLDYDQTTSVLTLSDPVDGDISNTVITSGRTVLLDDVSVTGTSEVSCIGLSNTVFPPPASTILVGNNPPRVEIPTGGVTPWFPGASFRATLGGTIDTVINNDDLVLTIYSNRGQASQQILNTFTLNLEDSSDIGWKWDVFFTCRSVNASPTLGVIACNSKFDYSKDGATPTPEGFVSNANASFDTSVDQYIDFTMQFQQSNNELTTNLFIIERIY